MTLTLMVTMLCAVSAMGLPLTLMIIYSKSFPGGQFRFDSELFLTWFPH